MPDKPFGLNSLADQRYYHFIVLRGEDEVNIAGLWRRLGDVQRAPRPVEFRSDVCEIHHRKARSDNAYARGAVSRLLSEKGNGEPPFFYDVFVGRVTLKADSFVLIGFPFAGLALDLSTALLGRDGTAVRGELQGALVPRVLATLEKDSPRQFSELSTRVVGVQFKVEDDKSLSAVRLGGDDPLGASIYRDYIKTRIEQGEVLPDSCVLACEKEWEGDASASERSITLRSRIHADTYGNFKFYAQAGCANLRLLPYAIGQLKLWGAMRRVAGNPLRRLTREEPE
jgi:hypothetical protein